MRGVLVILAVLAGPVVAAEPVVCVPAVRTVAPCPSGFAPGAVQPGGAGGFSTDMDGLPVQDMLFALGVAVCGLLGVSVGAKLV